MCCVIIVASLALWRFHKTADWRVLAAAAVVTTVAMAASFLLPWLVLKRNLKAAKAITVETAMQNTPTAIAFVVISFEGPVLGEILSSLVVAGFPGLPLFTLFLIIYRILKLRNRTNMSVVELPDGDQKAPAMNDSLI